MSRIRTGACREDRDAIRRHWPFADPKARTQRAVDGLSDIIGQLSTAGLWVPAVADTGHYDLTWAGREACAIGDCPAANACIDARRCLARRVDA